MMPSRLLQLPGEAALRLLFRELFLPGPYLLQLGVGIALQGLIAQVDQ